MKTFVFIVIASLSFSFFSCDSGSDSDISEKTVQLIEVKFDEVKLKDLANKTQLEAILLREDGKIQLASIKEKFADSLYFEAAVLKHQTDQLYKDIYGCEPSKGCYIMLYYEVVYCLIFLKKEKTPWNARRF